MFTPESKPGGASVRLVSHAVDGGHVIAGADGAAILTASETDGTVVVYEADEVDAASRAGWSVTVTGVARLVDDPLLLARFRQMLGPWTAGEPGHTVRIEAEVVTGFELAPGVSELSGHSNAEP